MPIAPRAHPAPLFDLPPARCESFWNSSPDSRRISAERNRNRQPRSTAGFPTRSPADGLDSRSDTPHAQSFLERGSSSVVGDFKAVIGVRLLECQSALCGIGVTNDIGRGFS